MRLVKTFCLVVITVLSANAGAAIMNVAEGASVTLNGSYGQLRVGSPWALQPVDSASSLTDGVFRPESTTWNEGSVWWDEAVPGSVGNSIEITLGSAYDLLSFSVQADDNDTYRIDYWNGVVWQLAWAIPKLPSFGLVTRNSGALGPITTDRLRFSATGGDRYYSVSEIQAFADVPDQVPVPEPGTLTLLGLGLLGLGFARRHQNKV